jgi:hypothetical protein
MHTDADEISEVGLFFSGVCLGPNHKPLLRTGTILWTKQQ